MLVIGNDNMRNRAPTNPRKTPQSPTLPLPPTRKPSPHPTSPAISRRQKPRPHPLNPPSPAHPLRCPTSSAKTVNLPPPNVTVDLTTNSACSVEALATYPRTVPSPLPPQRKLAPLVRSQKTSLRSSDLRYHFRTAR